MRRRGDALAIGASLLLLSIICLHWWHPGQVIAQGDNPPIVTPGIWFVKSLGAWSVYNSYFGQVDGSFTFLPFMLVWWPVDRIFGASLGQIVIDYTLIAAAWLGAYRAIRIFGCSAQASALGAWIYTINPFTQLVFGTNLTLAIFWGLLAWIAFWLIAASRFEARRTSARVWLVILAFAYVPMIGVTPSLVFQTAASALVLAGLCLLTTAAKRRFLRWLSATAVAMVLASLWWAVPDVLSFVGATIPHPTALADLTWTYARSSLLNDLRFLYTWLWAYPEYFPVAPSYDGNIVSYAAGFLPIASGIAGLIVLRGRNLLICRYALGVALIVAFITKGTHPPLAFVNSSFAIVPGAFLVYADPAGEVGLALLLLAVTAGLLVDEVIQRQRAWNSQGIKVAFATLALAAILTSGWPLVFGAVFHGPVVASNGSLMPSQYVALPSYWRQASDYLNSGRDDAGVLMLPPHLSSGYDVEYGFGYYGVDAVATNLIRRPLLYLDAGLIEGLGYLKHVEGQSVVDRVRVLLQTNPRLAESLIHDLGIRYILYRGDIIHEKNAWYSQGELSSSLGRVPLQFGPLALYDLGPTENGFALRTQWVAGTYADASAGDLMELAALEEPLPRVNATSSQTLSERPFLVEETGQDQDTSSAPLAGQDQGVDRALSFGSLPPAGASVVIRSASKRELRVSMGAVPDPIVVFDAPLKALRYQNPAGALLLSAHIVATSEEHGTITLTESVQNFGSRAVWADILVPAPLNPLRQYLLAANGFVYRAGLRAGGPGLILRFPHVLLPPGQIKIELLGQPVQNRVNAGAPPINDARENKIYSFYFTNIQAGGLPAVIGNANAQLPSEPADQLAEIGVLPLQYRSAEEPSVELNTGAQNPQVAAIVEFSSGRQVYRCPTQLVPGIGMDLNHAINDCLTQNLLSPPLSTVTFRSIHILAIRDPAVLSALAVDGRVLVSISPVNFSGESLGSPSSGATTRNSRILFTLRWPAVRPAVHPGDVISVRIDGCGGASDPSGSELVLHGTAAVKQLYRQRLFPTPDGADAGEAVISMRQAFAAADPVNLHELVATCALKASSRDAHEVRGHSLLLRRTGPALQVQAAGISKITLPAKGVVARSVGNPHTPLAVQFGALPPTASIAALGVPPSGGTTFTDCRSRGISCGGGIIRAAIPRGFGGLAVLDQLYSPSWIAVEIGNGVLMPAHVRADGWRNAWLVSRPGELIVFNLINLFAIAALVLGLWIIAWQIKRARA